MMRLRLAIVQKDCDSCGNRDHVQKVGSALNACFAFLLRWMC